MGYQVFKSTRFLILGFILLGVITGCSGGNSSRPSDGGNLIWAKNAGQATGSGIINLSDDSTIVTGWFQRLTTFGPGQMDQVTFSSDGILFDIFIARYDPNGKLSWVKRTQGKGSEFSNGIMVLSDNSTVISGCFEEAATFEPGEPNETILTSAGGRDIFTARYNPDGTLVWAKRAGGIEHEMGVGITSLADDSAVVTGWFADTVTFGSDEPFETNLTSAGHRDIFIARFNSDGTLAWAKRAGGTFPDEGHGITSLTDDSIVVTGHFIGTSTFGMEEPNQTVLTSNERSADIFIARYNPDGTLAWVKQAGGPKWDESFGITSLSDDSTVLTGCFEGPAVFGSREPDQITLKSPGKSDIFIARYNPDGSLAWAKQAGGSKHYDYGVGITALSDDSTVVTGYFYSKATFGQNEPNKIILRSAGKNDVFIARYNPDGTLAWAKCADMSDGAYGSAITTLSDDSVVVVGDFKESAIFGRGEPNEKELFSAKISDMFIARFAP